MAGVGDVSSASLWVLTGAGDGSSGLAGFDVLSLYDGGGSLNTAVTVTSPPSSLSFSLLPPSSFFSAAGGLDGLREKVYEADTSLLDPAEEAVVVVATSALVVAAGASPPSLDLVTPDAVRGLLVLVESEVVVGVKVKEGTEIEVDRGREEVAEIDVDRGREEGAEVEVDRGREEEGAVVAVVEV